MAPTTQFRWRHQWADDEREQVERDIAAIDCQAADDGMTQQHFATDADINTIVKRFGITDHSQLPAVTDPRYYGDFSDAPSFREALHNLMDAQERFEQLPADLRKRFNHDPIDLYEWVNDPNNAEEAEQLGLLKRMEPTPAEHAKAVAEKELSSSPPKPE